MKFFKNSKRSILIVIIILLLIGGGIYFFIGRSSGTANNVITETATKSDIKLLVSASGSVLPVNSYNINPQTSAKVSEVDVKPGDQVKAGQQLAKLDDTDLQNAVKSAQYTLNSAIYARNTMRQTSGTDSNASKQAQQQVNVASVNLTTAKNNLNKAIITSPADGEVLAVNLKVGDIANPTAIGTSAFLVGSSGALIAQLNVNELDIIKVKLEQPVNLKIDAVGEARSGKITEVQDNGVNVAGIIQYIVKTNIDPQTNLKPNMTVNADITIESKQNVIVIPSGTVQTKDGKTVVQLYKGNNSNNQPIIEVREVQIGINNNSFAEVVSGLNEGDKVVVSVTKSALTTILSGGK